MIPLSKIANVTPVTLKENPPEKYIQILTVDAHEFWFMGFVSYDKAVTHLLDAVANFAAASQLMPGPQVIQWSLYHQDKHHVLDISLFAHCVAVRD